MVLSPMWLTLAIAALATVLLLSGRVSADLVGLLTGVLLALTGLIAPEQALQGLSAPVVVVIFSVFILTKGLENSGVTEHLGRHMERLAGRSERRFLSVVLLAAALLSLFMNTIAAAAVLLPPVVAITRRESTFSLRRTLIPLAFGTLLGGTATLLTTANLVASAMLEGRGYAGYGLLDFLPVGLPVTLVGMLFLLTIGRRLLPQPEPPSNHTTPDQVLKELEQAYRLRAELHEVRVQAGSPLIGNPARRPGLARALGLTPLGRLHGKELVLCQHLPAEQRVRAGDLWLTVGEVSPQQLARLGLEERHGGEVSPLMAEDSVLAEVTLNPRAARAHATPKTMALYAAWGIRVLLIWRAGSLIARRVYDETLQPGDALLVYGTRESVKRLCASGEFVLLSQVGASRRQRRREPRLALLALGVALLPAALHWLPLSLSALLGVLVLLFGGVLSTQQAYQAVSWRVIFLIAGMIPLAQAMQQSGAAAFLSRQMLSWLGPAPPPWALMGVFIGFTILLAQVLSGQAAALIIVPLAIAAAEQYGLEPRALVMAVAVPASLGFLLPTAHPVNLLVMGPAGYQPRDYLKVGLPLTLVLIPVIVGAIRLFWL